MKSVIGRRNTDRLIVQRYDTRRARRMSPQLVSMLHTTLGVLAVVLLWAIVILTYLRLEA